jgi:hypothetical protein
MKNDKIYTYYLTYLTSRLNEGKISNGSFSLLKMSNDSFENFKFKYENDEIFSSKVIKLHTSEIRDQKIDDIFDDID